MAICGQPMTSHVRSPGVWTEIQGLDTKSLQVSMVLYGSLSRLWGSLIRGGELRPQTLTL